MIHRIWFNSSLLHSGSSSSEDWSVTVYVRSWQAVNNTMHAYGVTLTRWCVCGFVYYFVVVFLNAITVVPNETRSSVCVRTSHRDSASTLADFVLTMRCQRSGIDEFYQFHNLPVTVDANLNTQPNCTWQPNTNFSRFFRPRAHVLFSLSFLISFGLYGITSLELQTYETQSPRVKFRWSSTD